MSEEKDQLTGHDYDGIKEYNNPLPTWWLWTFFGTIIFAFIYYIHYELGGAPSMEAELSEGLAVIAAKQNAHQKKSELSDSDLNGLIAKADLTLANTEFQSKCTACHGDHLQGGIGPNLTDAYWIHGQGSAADIVKTIKNGILDKGMPSWEASMKSEQIIAVAAYILSKQDSNPAGAKAPQGEKVR
jgi:cytochrome c oxidase cbb3-type subunit 3